MVSQINTVILMCMFAPLFPARFVPCLRLLHFDCWASMNGIPYLAPFFCCFSTYLCMNVAAANMHEISNQRGSVIHTAALDICTEQYSISRTPIRR